MSDNWTSSGCCASCRPTPTSNAPRTSSTRSAAHPRRPSPTAEDTVDQQPARPLTPAQADEAERQALGQQMLEKLQRRLPGVVPMTAQRPTPHLDTLAELADRAAQAKAKGRALAQAVAENDHADRRAQGRADLRLRRGRRAQGHRAAEEGRRRQRQGPRARRAARRRRARRQPRPSRARPVPGPARPRAPRRGQARRGRRSAGGRGRSPRVRRRVGPARPGRRPRQHADPRASTGSCTPARPTNDAYAQLELAARRTLDSGPPQPPLPGDVHQTITIPAVDDPDPDVREAARARPVPGGRHEVHAAGPCAGCGESLVEPGRLCLECREGGPPKTSSRSNDTAQSLPAREFRIARLAVRCE